MTNEKVFPKPISQRKFDYGLFTYLPKIIVVCDFSASSFKLWKRYPTSLDNILILENYLSYQANIFLVNWTLRELTPCKIFHICRCNFKEARKSVFVCFNLESIRSIFASLTGMKTNVQLELMFFQPQHWGELKILHQVFM